MKESRSTIKRFLYLFVFEVCCVMEVVMKRFVLLMFCASFILAFNACTSSSGSEEVTFGSGLQDTLVYDLRDNELDEESDILRPTPFSTYLPIEFMAFYEGHELPIEDNPVTGIYRTTSDCIMVLMAEGQYIWQDSPDTTAITGFYEVFEGSLKGQEDGKNLFVLESDTGPVYTVIVTFNEGQGTMGGTIQVFDFIDDEVFYVTDLFNDIWFRAFRVIE